MFRQLTLRGTAATIVWAYHDAAVLRTWTIAKQAQQRGLPPVWRLAARIAHADAFKCRQRPLLFTAAHPKGRWCWQIETLDIIGDRLSATLGPPEQ